MRYFTSSLTGALLIACLTVSTAWSQEGSGQSSGQPFFAVSYTHLTLSYSIADDPVWIANWNILQALSPLTRLICISQNRALD